MQCENRDSRGNGASRRIIACISEQFSLGSALQQCCIFRTFARCKAIWRRRVECASARDA
eukprot:2476187-Lingulodinium_polyedra.AAC.1